jgi:hypothetical protein
VFLPGAKSVLCSSRKNTESWQIWVGQKVLELHHGSSEQGCIVIFPSLA